MNIFLVSTKVALLYIKQIGAIFAGKAQVHLPTNAADVMRYLPCVFDGTVRPMRTYGVAVQSIGSVHCVCQLFSLSVPIHHKRWTSYAFRSFTRLQQSYGRMRTYLRLLVSLATSSCLQTLDIPKIDHYSMVSSQWHLDIGIWYFFGFRLDWRVATLRNGGRTLLKEPACTLYNTEVDNNSLISRQKRKTKTRRRVKNNVQISWSCLESWAFVLLLIDLKTAIHARSVEPFVSQKSLGEREFRQSKSNELRLSSVDISITMLCNILVCRLHVRRKLSTERTKDATIGNIEHFRCISVQSARINTPHE